MIEWNKPLTHREYLMWVLALVLVVTGGSILVAMVWTFQDVVRAILEPGFVQMVALMFAVPAIAGLVLLVTLLFSSPAGGDGEPEAAEQQRVSVREWQRFGRPDWSEIGIERPAGYLERHR